MGEDMTVLREETGVLRDTGARCIDGNGRRATAEADDEARRADQLRFMRQHGAIVFGWISFTSALAVIHPFGGPRTLPYLLIAFACTLSLPTAFPIAWRGSACWPGPPLPGPPRLS